MADGVVYKPLVACVDSVQKSLVADGAICKPLVVYGDRHLQAFGGYFWHLQAFGGRESRINAFVGIRRSLFTSLWWQTDSFASL